MIHVFIGYGGARAEEVANDLNVFLNNERQINTFLASPQAHHVVSTDEWKAEIKKNLLDCNIVVFVCHEGTPRSREVNREINFLFENKMENKVICFANTDTCIPRRLRERWHPLHFPPEKPAESFCRLLNEVFRCHIKFLESARIISDKEGMV